MEIFVVSFLIFTAVCLILWFCQRLSKGQLPVGCTPATGTCCRLPGGPLGEATQTTSGIPQ